MPGDEDDEMLISYWDFMDELSGGKPIDGSMVGDMFHIAFFKADEKNNPVFDDAFEAILSCPKTYVKNLVGCGVYGCIVRKTDKSEKWFEEYLFKVVGHDRIKKMVDILQSVVSSK